MAQGAVYSFYNKIDVELKRRGFVRYDSFNKRSYFFYPSTVALAGSKFGSSSLGNKAMCFDLQIGAWQPPIDYSTDSTFLISDMITIPSKSFFATSDFRNAEYRKVNILLMATKNEAQTDVRFAILEGKPYCTVYFESVFKTAFKSFFE